jgi:hypothetical protein
MPVTFEMAGTINGLIIDNIRGCQQDSTPSCRATWIFDTGTIGIGYNTLCTQG